MDSSDEYSSNVAEATIYSDPGHPYYVFCGPYARHSAGMKVLHLLCHTLNRRGRLAFVQVFPDVPPGIEAVSPDLLTPRLTQDIVDRHFAEGRTPIVVYPEAVSGNPLQAGCVVRYVLNFPGVIGGELSYAPDELDYGYTAELAAAGGQPENVLFLPVSDTRVFYPPEPGATRSGTCYYAVKYRRIFGGVPVPPDPDSLEITQARTPQELAEIFRRCELLYCFESTATAIDAALCGCPTVFLPNPFLKQLIAAGEYGGNGYAWGNEPAAIEYAKATVGAVRSHFDRAAGRYWGQLDAFIAATQKKAAGTPYASPLNTGLRRYGRRSKQLARRIAILRDIYWLKGTRGVVGGLLQWVRIRKRIA